MLPCCAPEGCLGGHRSAGGEQLHCASLVCTHCYYYYYYYFPVLMNYLSPQTSFSCFFPPSEREGGEGANGCVVPGCRLGQATTPGDTQEHPGSTPLSPQDTPSYSMGNQAPPRIRTASKYLGCSLKHLPEAQMLVPGAPKHLIGVPKNLPTASPASQSVEKNQQDRFCLCSLCLQKVKALDGIGAPVAPPGPRKGSPREHW